ncbi:MAG TPA: hypothetical protein VD907_05250 [Verrucomicrobiae bacterium]|nr:hypothetical protein [Verrucomicrobiae bacterium]
MPTSRHRQLGIVAVGLEHHSQPQKREGMHIVPWTRAGETIRYAEKRVDLYASYEYVTPENAAEIAGFSTDVYEALPESPMRDHMLGIIAEARAYLQHQHRFEKQDFFPVVYSIDSNLIPSNTVMEGTGSRVRHDVEVKGIIPLEAIKGIFAPSAKLETLQDWLNRHNQERIATLPLEKLRSLDKAEYGHLLR